MGTVIVVPGGDGWPTRPDAETVVWDTKGKADHPRNIYQPSPDSEPRG